MYALNEGPVNEQRFHILGKALHWQRYQLGQKGSFQCSQKSPATVLWQAGQSETYYRCSMLWPYAPQPETGACQCT